MFKKKKADTCDKIKENHIRIVMEGIYLKNRNEALSLLGVPMDLGADRRGVDMGPSAIRYAAVKERWMILAMKWRIWGIYRFPLLNPIQ